MADSGVRLTELLASLSLATDLGFGQPAEHTLRAARISMRVGERLGLDTTDLATLYDVSLLTYVGCQTYGNEAATLFGDDIDFRAQAIQTDLAGMPGRKLMMSRAGYGTNPLNRARRTVQLMATNGRGVLEQMANHCSAAGELADRLGLGHGVSDGVAQAYARWDGNGVPADLRGEDLALSARISHVGAACEVFLRSGGADAAVDMVRARTGSHFDPQIAAAVVADAATCFQDIDENTVDEVLDAEPIERPPLSDAQLDAALEAIGDFCDLRHPCFAGHSRGTAELAAAAAGSMHVAAGDVALLRRAALVHDVGTFGVPGGVWDKPGPLSSGERERMRMHVYYVDRIFSRPEPLRRIGLLAATHRERMDGSGNHRGVGGTMLSMPARVLAAADAYDAMTRPRPYRAALSSWDAAEQLRSEAVGGLLDPAAVDAVLAAAGHAASRSRAGGPAGLTAREGDVLGLLARGLSNKAIGRELGISPKTVGNHVERIYAKLGVTNRAAAAMRAMQHGLA